MCRKLETRHIGVGQHPRLVADDTLAELRILFGEFFPGPRQGIVHANRPKYIFLQLLDIKADDRSIRVVGHILRGWLVEQAVHTVPLEHAQGICN